MSGNAKPKPLGKRQREAVWTAWNAMPNGETYAVRKIALKLGLDERRVAATVYPEATFGKWEPGDAG
jgi:hypothetical protein